MIFLVIILFLHYNLIYCDVFEKAASSLKTEYGDKTNIDNLKNDTITDSMQDNTSRTEIDQISSLPSTISTTSSSTHDLQYLRQGASDYIKMKKILHEGYMVVFLIELTRLLATKDPLSTLGVVRHAEEILHSFIKKGNLQWLGEPLIYVCKNIAKLMRESEMSVVQDYANQMHAMISKRKEQLTPEANQVLDRVEKVFTDDDGESLFEMLKEFEAFPKISLSGYWLCYNMINTFLAPLRHMGDTKERQDLMDAVNKEIKKRFNANDLNDTTVLRGQDGASDETSNEADYSAKIEDTKTKFVMQKELVSNEELHTSPKNTLIKQDRQKKLMNHKEPTTQKEFVTSEELGTLENSKELFTQKEKAKTTSDSQKKIIFNVKIITHTQQPTASQELVLQEKIVASEELLASFSSQELINREKHFPFKKSVTSKNILHKIPVVKNQHVVSKEPVTQKELSSEEFIASEELLISKELLTQKEQTQTKSVTTKKIIPEVKIVTQKPLTSQEFDTQEELPSSQELFNINREKQMTFQKPAKRLPKNVKSTPKRLVISEELSIEKELVTSKEHDKTELDIKKELLNSKEVLVNSEELVIGKGLVNAKELASKKELGTQNVLKHKEARSKEKSLKVKTKKDKKKHRETDSHFYDIFRTYDSYNDSMSDSVGVDELSN